MPVYLDVESRFDVRAAERVAREAVQIWTRAGDDISRGLGGNLAKAFGAIDGSVIRRELQSIEAEYIRLRDAEMEAARVATRSAAEVEAAQRRVAEVTAKYTAESSQAALAQAKLVDAQAKAARDMRLNADAIVATEGAHRALTEASDKSGVAASRAGQLFNAAGVIGVGGFGVALAETTKKAADFQQSMIKLSAAADVPASELKTVSDGLLKLAGQVPYTAQQLSEAFYDVAKAGYKGADGLKVIQVGAQLASVEGADLKEVINGLTTTVNDFHFPADKLAETASKINVAVGDAKTNLTLFSGSLHNIEPVASIANNQMEQVYAAMARFSQSGFSMDQGTQNMAQMYRNFMGPNQQMRDAIGKLGLSMNDLQNKIADPNVGIIGVLQILSDTVRQHTGPDGQIAIDTFYKNADAAAALKQEYDGLTGKSKELADAINSGVLPPMKELFQQKEMDPKLAQWDIERKKVEGFSSNLKKMQGDLEPVQQLWKEITGTAEGFNMASVLAGSPEALQATIDEWKKLQGVVVGANDPVKGFTETNQGLNTQLKEAKAAFSAAETELGTAFIPYITDAAKGAKWLGDELSKHPAIAQDVAIGLGVMGGAWLTIKGYNIVSTILSPIATGLGMLRDKLFDVETEATTAGTTMRNMGAAAAEGEAGVLAAADAEVAAEGRVAASASEANAALAGGRAAGGAGLAGGLAAASGPLAITAIAADAISSGEHWVDQQLGGRYLEQFAQSPVSAVGIMNMINGHAHGGAVHGPGPTGHDSVLSWLAPGEHVLTHHDVARMGGHKAVHAFRNALHRQYGGPAGPDVAVAESMVGHAYNQGSRWDCSGVTGRVILGALGLPATSLPTTQNMGSWLSQLGFRNGIGGPGTISVGWYNHGSAPNDGHAAMTLSNGENAESGGSHGNFIVGAGAAGAANPEFDHHMYLPTLYGEGAGGGMPGGMGGGGFGGMGGGGLGGGGIPAGATPGTGPGGQPGYYMPNQEKIAADQERLRHLDAEIADAEKRKTEMKSDAKQSERDRVDEEIRHLREERNLEQQRLQEAERGSFHALRGGRGRGGGENPFLPVPLASNFGLSKGLPGLVEWGIGALEDVVLGPLETAAMASMGMSTDMLQPGGGAGMGGASPVPLGGGFGMPPGPGDYGFGAPGSPAAGSDAGPGVEGPGGGNSPGAGSGTASSGTGGSTPAQWWGGWHPSSHPAPQSGMSKFTPDWAAPPPTLPPGLAPLIGEGGSKPLPHAAGPVIMPGYTGGQAPWIPGFTPGFASGGLSDSFPGGPQASDTIPAWLSPGEMVMNTRATNQFLPYLQAMNQAPQYFSGGSDAPVAPQPQLPNTQNPGTGKPQGSGQSGLKTALPGAQQPGGPPAPAPGASAGMPIGPQPTGGGAASPGIHEGMSDTPAPGAHVAQPGQDLPASPGIGFSGGLIGGLEGAATSAAAMGADIGTFGAGGGAASAAMQIGFQELNRAAAYGAQVGGIAILGLHEALRVSDDSTGGDWGKTIPGRLVEGVAGVRPSQNTAGQTQTPMGGGQNAGYADASGGDTHYHYHNDVHGPVTVNANDPMEFHSGLQSFNDSLTTGENRYPMSGSMFTGRS